MTDVSRRRFGFNISLPIKMPIVDGELIGERVDDNFLIPDVPLGIYTENSIRKNVTQ